MMRMLIGAAVGLLLVAPASAQSDHLECFKLKDSARKAVYRARLEGLAPPRGCKVALPAKLMCVPTARPEMAPPLGPSAVGANSGAFLCYSVRCRRNTAARLTVADEFGRRIVRPRGSRLLCAPLPAPTEGTEPPATTTTLVCPQESTTTSLHTRRTTTTTTISTTTTTLPGCDVPNTACGSCGNGACQPIRPTGELICAYQTQAFCQGSCQSKADCPAEKFCVGGSGNAGTCCTPCF
jgi:hypothetical protein